MSRGGRRDGAGRRHKLNHTERIHLGSICENRFRQMWQEAREQRWSDRRGVCELRALHAKARSTPLSDRVGFSYAAERQQHTEDVEFAIREIRGTPDFVEETRRVFALEAPRPKGVKADICDAVASEVREKWKLPEIGRRYVQRCWDEYRAFERETATGV